MYYQKCGSTLEIIKKLQAYEELYGVGAVTSIGSVCSGSREIEYVFCIEDKNGENKVEIEIASVRQNEL